MATIFRLPRVKPVDSSGVPYAGAKAYFYTTGTTNAEDTYSDAALTTANANPVVADAAGLFGIIYLDPSVVYKLKLTDSDDVELYTEDPVSESVNVIGNTIVSKSGTYTTTASDNGKVIECTGTFTLTLLAAATAGVGFTQVITNVGTGVITVDGDGSETINGATTVVLGVNESLFIACDGSKWSGVFATAHRNNLETITGAETVAVGDRNRVYYVTSGTFSVSLPAAATAGEGFTITVVNQGSGTVTIDPNSTETVNGQTTLALAPSTSQTSASWMVLTCDGSSNWVATVATIASTTLEGMVELATTAETRTGTDTARAITAAGLANTIYSLNITVNVAGTSTINDANAGASGWSIADGDQTGEAVITHNLGLNAATNLHVVATVDSGADAGSSAFTADIEDSGLNSFQVQVSETTTTPTHAAVDGEKVNIIAYQVP